MVMFEDTGPLSVNTTDTQRAHSSPHHAGCLSGGVALRCETPTQLQGGQMAQRVPERGDDAASQLPAITSLSLSIS